MSTSDIVNVVMTLGINRVITNNSGQANRVSINNYEVGGILQVPASSPPLFLSLDSSPVELTLTLDEDETAEGWAITRVGPFYDGGNGTVINAITPLAGEANELVVWSGLHSPPLIESSLAVLEPRNFFHLLVAGGPKANWAMITIHMVKNGAAFSEWIPVRFR